jgi:hypothetical protein
MLLACAVTVGAVSACDEVLPTASSDGGLPGEPVTVEVEIPWGDFAGNLEVFGGYSTAGSAPRVYVAKEFGGTLDARALARFAPYPTSATVVDSTGASRPDYDLTFLSGNLIVAIDVDQSRFSGPVNLAVAATEEAWDPRTATWEFAVDTANDQRPWPEAGGGAVTPLASTVWDPAAGDSVIFPLDSATIAAWGDTTAVARGVRLEAIDAGSRLQVRNLQLRLTVLPSIRPDTLIELPVGVASRTFIYTPSPAAPVDGMRIGGAPAWRSVLDVNMPATINGPPEFCAAVACPHTLEAGQISFASLVLATRAPDVAFAPADSVRLDVRQVYDRSALPKAPVSASILPIGGGILLLPDDFTTGGRQVEIPFTNLARNLVDGVDARGNPVSNTLVLMVEQEPWSLGFAEFTGPGSLIPPYLRLVLTIGPGVGLP